MKNLFTILLLVLFVSNTNAQDSKFYIGVGAGLATMGGDINDGDAYSGTGLNINFLNMGLRLNETWGLTANFSSSGFDLEEGDGAFGAGVFSVGPMLSFPMGNMTWDLKPQIILGLSGVWNDTDTLFDDATMKGSGFVIGNSIVMGEGKGFSWSIDLDYVIGNYDEIEDYSADLEIDSSFSSLKAGVGVRYNF